jgi:hypothetical protein
MRGLSLIGGLVLSLLPLLVAHADEVQLEGCQCLCALNCRGKTCEVVACDALAWGPCTVDATQVCRDQCCSGLDPQPPVIE